jgi:O-antigen/teichoic acid export membrane protein
MLGVEQYGIYALVISFVGFFGILDLGVSPSMVKYVAEYHATQQYNKIRKMFSTALSFYLTIGTIAALMIATFSYYLAPQVLKVSAANEDLLQTVLYIAAVGFLVNMVLSAFSAMPGAVQRFDLPSKINLVGATVSSAATVGLLYLGLGLIAVVVLGVVISVIAIVVYGWVNKMLIPQLQYVPRFDRPSFKLMLTFGAYATIGVLASTVLFQLDKIILGSTLGAAAVAYYVLPGSIAIKIHGSIAALSNIVFPLTSDLFATGNLDRLRALYKRATRIVVTLLVLAVTPMFLLAYPFLYYWVGENFATNSTFVMQILVLTYSILALTAIPFYVLYGAGQPKIAALFSVLSGALNIGLLYALIPNWGINGAAVAYLLAVLPALGFIRVVEKRILNLPVRDFYLQLGMRMVALAAISLALTALARPLITSLSSFVGVYLLVVLVSGGLFLLFRLADPKDMELLQEIRNRLRTS